MRLLVLRSLRRVFTSHGGSYEQDLICGFQAKIKSWLQLCEFLRLRAWWVLRGGTGKAIRVAVIATCSHTPRIVLPRRRQKMKASAAACNSCQAGKLIPDPLSRLQDSFQLAYSYQLI